MTGQLPFEMLDAMPIGAALLDSGGRILHANPLLERLAERDLRPLAGHEIQEAFPQGVLVSDPQAGGGSSGHARLLVNWFPHGSETYGLALVGGPTGEQLREGLEAAHDDVLARVSRARHEINNLLMAVVGHLELMSTRPETQDTIRKRCGTITTLANRIREQMEGLGPRRQP